MFRKLLLIEKIRPSSTRPFYYKVYVREGWPLFRRTVVYVRTLETRFDREYPEPHWFSQGWMITDPLLLSWLEDAIDDVAIIGGNS